MDILIGLLIIAIGSFCQSSSYVPIKKVKEWSWESFWLIQGVFAWLVFPFLGLSLIHISEPTRLGMISYAVFCLKKKKTRERQKSRKPTSATETLNIKELKKIEEACRDKDT